MDRKVGPLRDIRTFDDVQEGLVGDAPLEELEDPVSHGAVLRQVQRLLAGRPDEFVKKAAEM
jgi:hypothetical protein